MTNAKGKKPAAASVRKSKQVKSNRVKPAVMPDVPPPISEVLSSSPPFCLSLDGNPLGAIQSVFDSMLGISTAPSVPAPRPGAAKDFFVFELIKDVLQLQRCSPRAIVSPREPVPCPFMEPSDGGGWVSLDDVKRLLVRQIGNQTQINAQ